MAGVNKAIIVGNLGKDPEVRSMNNGKEVCSFSVATSESWKNQAGERQERTEWHNVVIFNENLVKVAKNYLRKGSKVYLEGQIQTRKWQDKDGKDRYSTEIVLQAFHGQLVLLDKKEDGSSSGGGGGYSGGSSSGGGYSGGSGENSGGYSGSRPQPAAFDTDLDDDVPF